MLIIKMWIKKIIMRKKTELFVTNYLIDFFYEQY